jgi:hypothetical protein
MAEKQVAKPVALAVGAALAGSFAVTGTAAADTGVSPFSMTTLSVATRKPKKPKAAVAKASAAVIKKPKRRMRKVPAAATRKQKAPVVATRKQKAPVAAIRKQKAPVVAIRKLKAPAAAIKKPKRRMRKVPAAETRKQKAPVVAIRKLKALAAVTRKPKPKKTPKASAAKASAVGKRPANHSPLLKEYKEGSQQVSPFLLDPQIVEAQNRPHIQCQK